VKVAVLSMFRTTFCAVPALRRVEPATTSGPVGTSIATAASRPMEDPGAPVTATVKAVAAPAWRIAASVYGVSPLALTPTTASAAPMEAATTS
jgi:hypothetical protein